MTIVVDTITKVEITPIDLSSKHVQIYQNNAITQHTVKIAPIERRNEVIQSIISCPIFDFMNISLTWFICYRIVSTRWN